MKLSSTLPVLALGATLALPAVANANDIRRGRNFGLGVVAGYPGFGASMNYFFSEHLSLQVDPQVYLWRGSLWAGGRVDLLFYPGEALVRHNAFDLLWYFGGGLGVGVGFSEGYVSVFPELAVGIGFHFKRVPIDLMLEAVPQLWIGASRAGNDDLLHVWVTGALHCRYYF